MHVARQLIQVLHDDFGYDIAIYYMIDGRKRATKRGITICGLVCLVSVLAVGTENISYVFEVEADFASDYKEKGTFWGVGTYTLKGAFTLKGTYRHSFSAVLVKIPSDLSARIFL
jgi:hypothetical protein